MVMFFVVSSVCPQACTVEFMFVFVWSVERWSKIDPNRGKEEGGFLPVLMRNSADILGSATAAEQIFILEMFMF